jgi:hypothetical protein
MVGDTWISDSFYQGSRLSRITLVVPLNFGQDMFGFKVRLKEIYIYIYKVKLVLHDPTLLLYTKVASNV